MSDLSVKKPITTVAQKEDNNKSSSDTLYKRIESTNINKELFKTFLEKKNTNISDTYSQSPINKEIYRAEKSDVNDKKNKYAVPIVIGTTIVLGGFSVILGRKNLIKLREKLANNMESLKEHKAYKKVDKAKIAVMKFFNNLVGLIFTGDKIKDFSILNTFESLGAPGRFVVKLSRATLALTEKITLKGNYNKLKNNANRLGNTIKNAVAQPDDFANINEKQLAERMNVLINGNKDNKGLAQFSNDLLDGLKERTDKLKSVIKTENIDKYRENYFPTSLSWSEIKRSAKNWKKFLLAKSENKDVLREHWEKTEEAIISNVNKVGANNSNIRNFGESRTQLDAVAKEAEDLINQEGCSKKFKTLARKVKDLNKNINNSVNFETSGEKYAGRVLDLQAGGGMPEILLPPVAGGLVAYHTYHNTKPEDRKEKFIRSGGPELIGGLASWMVVANVLAISGATGLLTGFATAGIIHLLCNKYAQNIDRKKNRIGNFDVNNNKNVNLKKNNV